MYQASLTPNTNKDIFIRQKIDLIKNFPIPNSAEDIVEFFILASSNIDMRYYFGNSLESELTRAWDVKMDQAYSKAKIIMQGNNSFKQIEDLYNHKEEAKKHDFTNPSNVAENKNDILVGIICFVFVALIYVLGMIMMRFVGPTLGL